MPPKKKWKDREYPLTEEQTQLNQLGIMNKVCNEIGISRSTREDRVFTKRELLTIWSYINQAKKTVEMQRVLLRKYERILGFDFDVE